MSSAENSLYNFAGICQSGLSRSMRRQDRDLPATSIQSLRFSFSPRGEPSCKPMHGELTCMSRADAHS